MPKTIAELKEAAASLRNDAKLGRANTKTAALLLADLVVFVAHSTPVVLDTTVENATTTAPVKRQRRRKTVLVGGDTPVDPTPTVAGEPASTPVLAASENKTLPLNIKAGRGVRVGSQGDAVDTRVRVGSIPTNPVGQVTVGGRTRD